MERSKLVKYVTAAAVTTGMAIALPPLALFAAPFVAPFVAPLMASVLPDSVITKLGESGVNAVASIFSNLASSAIWESPGHFTSRENQDLLRLLANAYLEAVKEFVPEESDREQAEKVLPLVQKRIKTAIDTKREDDLINLFPLDRNSRKGDPTYSFANRISSGDVILEMADEAFSENNIFADEIEISLRRWYNEQKTAETQKGTGLTTIGLSAEPLPEPLCSALREQLSKSIPKKIGELIKTEGFEKSWTAFQRSHLQAILKEIKNNKSLSAEDRKLLEPLGEELNKLSHLEDLPEQLADSTREILLHSDKSKEEIIEFVRNQNIHFHKHLSAAEKRLSDQLSETKSHLSDQLSGTEKHLSGKLDDFLTAVKAQTNEKGLPSNVPRAQDFIGREDYLDALSGWYDGGARCFVLHGMGGAGKTELAKKFAFSIKADYDADIFIDLRGAGGNPMTAADAMWQIVSEFYPETPRPQIPLSDPRTGREFTRDEQDAMEMQVIQTHYIGLLNKYKILIVLDNAKDDAHVSAFNELSGDCLIVTSRQRLYLENCEAKNIEEMMEIEAVKMLKRKLGTARFNGEAEKIAKLCGYLPLALRAAEGVLFNEKMLGAASYAKKLETTRLKLHNPKRDISVEAAFDLSYDYLEAEYQNYWRRLAVFPADFDIPAAATVWETEIETAENALAKLESYGLLKWNEETRRCKMHDLMRQYAGEKLTADERFQAEFQFAAYYVSILVRAQQMQNNREENYYSNALKLIDTEWDNITAGQNWSAQFIEKDDLIAGFCIVYSGYGRDFINLRLHPRQNIDWLEFGLKAVRKQNSRQAESSRLGNLGNRYHSLGEYRKAIEYHEQAIAISREIGNRSGESSSLGNLGNAYHSLGKYRKAIEYHEQAIVISREIGSRSGEGINLGSLGNAYYSLGEYRKAIDYYEEAIAISREIGDPSGEGIILGNLGNASLSLDESRKAIDYYEQALVISREIGNRSGESSSLGNLGSVYQSLGKYRKAIEYHEQAIVISREIGFRSGEGSSLGSLGNAYDSLGEYQKAIDYHEQSLVIFREIGDRSGEGSSLGNLGNAYHSLGEYQKAINYHEQSLVISREIGDRSGEGISSSNLGIIYYNLGKKEKACGLWKDAAAIFEAIESPNASVVRQRIEKFCN